VVLVEPGDSRNVGSTARAMSNLGFRNLHLVAPPRYDPADAATTACWAVDLLEQARVHPTLEAALDSMHLVVGFSIRRGRNRPPVLLLEDCPALFAQTEGNIALLFGPEDTGLRQEHAALCSRLVRIPSAVENPSYNLSQSVLLALFELSRGTVAPPPALRAEPPATQREFQELDRIIEDVLHRSRFFHKGTPEPLPELIQHLMRRIGPTARELRVLMGMFSKVNKVLAGRVPLGSLPPRTAQAAPRAAQAAPRAAPATPRAAPATPRGEDAPPPSAPSGRAAQ